MQVALEAADYKNRQVLKGQVLKGVSHMLSLSQDPVRRCNSSDLYRQFFSQTYT